MNQQQQKWIENDIYDLIAEVQIAEKSLYKLLCNTGTLLSVMHEEVHSNGGNFNSMYSDIMFRQRFEDDTASSILDTLDNLIKKIEDEKKKLSR
jgi:hypothetical protein|tara:strand:- start:8691 stop:8972 length:282 start_codon:yes stop_codon:yes gene_type:complete